MKNLAHQGLGLFGGREVDVLAGYRLTLGPRILDSLARGNVPHPAILGNRTELVLGVRVRIHDVARSPLLLGLTQPFIQAVALLEEVVPRLHDLRQAHVDVKAGHLVDDALVNEFLELSTGPVPWSQAGLTVGDGILDRASRSLVGLRPSEGDLRPPARNRPLDRSPKVDGAAGTQSSGAGCRTATCPREGVGYDALDHLVIVTRCHAPP